MSRLRSCELVSANQLASSWLMVIGSSTRGARVIPPVPFTSLGTAQGEATLLWMAMEDEWQRRLDWSATCIGIGRVLRAIHIHVIDEPLPGTLTELSRQLDERTGTSRVHYYTDQRETS
jgi:hypothetical protein